jgi:hypothetical protein
MHGSASYPGVVNVKSATMNWTHGISPSRCTIELTPQPGGVAPTGTLTLMFGDSVVSFPNCCADHGSAEFTGSGEIWQLQILDRRYKWAWGEISGSYNLRWSDGTINESTKRSPRQLARLCLDAMGEKSANCNALPSDGNPTVEWSYTNPADALAELCDLYGCYVVLGLDNRVRLCKIGQGKSLPDGAILSYGCDANPPEKPGKLGIACGPNRYQVDFDLEAVGLDTDGSVKLINDLSYKPSAGWNVADYPFYLDVTATRDRELAVATVYKWYRVKEPISVPGYDGVVSSRIQVLPIIGQQCSTSEQTASDGKKVLQDDDAQVYGVWFARYDLDTNSATSMTPMEANTLGTTICRRSWSLDEARGIVQFGEPIYKNTAADGAAHSYGAPELRLRASCNVRDPTTQTPKRYAVTRSVGNRNDATLYVQKPDVVRRYIPTYGAGFKVTGLTDNRSDVDAECNHYLDQLAADYQTVEGATVPYAGLIRQDLDGAIRQVVWSINEGGTTTAISRNTESRTRGTPYVRRRQAERAAAQRRTVGYAAARAIASWVNALGRFVR